MKNNGNFPIRTDALLLKALRSTSCGVKKTKIFDPTEVSI